MSSTASRTVDTSSDRLLAALGVGYPILNILGFAAFPQPPGGDVSAAHDPTWLAGHTGATITQSYVRGAAALAFMVLAVAVGRAVVRTTGRRGLAAVATAGGVTCAALLLAAQCSTLAAALAGRGGVGVDTIRAFDALDEALLSVSGLPAIVLFGAAGWAFLRSSDEPRWFSLLTLAGAPLAVVDALSYDGSPFEAVGMLGLLFFLVWSLAAAAVLSRKSSPAESGAPVPAVASAAG